MKKNLLFTLLFLLNGLLAQAQITTATSATILCSGSGSTFPVTFSSSGTVYQTGNVFTAELSDAAGSFAAPVAVGSMAGTNTQGSITATLPASVPAGTGYRIRVVASAPVVIGGDNGSDLMVQPVPVVTAIANSATTCQGQTTTLSASGASTYAWTGSGLVSSTGPVVAAVPSITTTYTVTGTTGIGCAATATVVVNVAPVPAIVATATPATICQGQSTVLAATGATSYTWTPATMLNAIYAPSVTAYPTATVTFTVTGNSGGCNAMATVVVTVHPSPAVIATASPIQICQGGSSTLSASGATAYSWFPFYGLSGSSGATTTAAPSVTTTYTVTGTNTGTGCSSMSTVTVTVQGPAPPQLSVSGSTCPGQTATLNASGPANATYQWTGPNAFSSTQQNPVLTNISAANYGYYSVTMTVPGNPCASSANILLGPAPAPLASTTPFLCPGDPIQLTASTVPGISYSWVGPNNFSSTQQNPVVASATAAAVGTYTVYGVTPGCASLPSIAVVALHTAPVLSYPASVYCTSATTMAQPQLTSSTTGTFTAAPSGLALNPQSGILNPAASLPGSYTITFTGAAACVAPVTFALQIQSSPAATFSYSQAAYCQSMANPVAQLGSGSAAGTFSAFPSGLVFANTATGQINLSQSQPGTYTVMNTLPASGPCAATSYSTFVTIQPFLTAPAVSTNAPLCQGQTLQLSATGAPGTTFSWTGPGSFSSTQPNVSIPNATVSASGTYTVTASLGGCLSAPFLVPVTVSVAPSLTVSANSPVIQGGTLFLSGNGTGGTYTWTGPANFVATGSNPVRQNMQVNYAGTYTATLSGPLGCPPTTASVVVQVTPLNQIKGTIYNDANSNGTRDPGEAGLPNHIVRLIGSPAQFASSNNQGQYALEVGAGSYSVEVVNLTAFQTAVPSLHTASFTVPAGQADTGNDFGIQVIPVQELAVNINRQANFRPGFLCTYLLELWNVGNTTVASPTLKLRKDPLLVFSSSLYTPSAISGDTIIWNFGSPLTPNQSIYLYVTFTLPSSVSLGTVITSELFGLPIAGDVNVANNSAILSVVASGSYDPNDKMVNPLGDITPLQVTKQDPLTYTIHFQNTGTDSAFSILVVDTLSRHLDVGSFEMLTSSHPYQLNLHGTGIAEWRFENVQLPDSNTNEPASHGYLQYRIKPKTTLAIGDVIENTAAIYFDFNAPVHTNTTVTAVNMLGAAPAVDVASPLVVYPNPSSGQFILRYRSPLPGTVQVRVLNVLGRVVQQAHVAWQGGMYQHSFNLNREPSGLYLLQVTEKGKTQQVRLLKQ